MVSGGSVNYVSGMGHIDLPKVDDDTTLRKAHRPWCSSCKRTVALNAEDLCEECAKAAIVKARLAAAREEREKTTAVARPATKPKTKAKKTMPYAVELTADELDARFTAHDQASTPDDTSLGRELDELEATDPVVAAAAVSLDAVIQRTVHPEEHVVPANLDIETATSHTALLLERITAAFTEANHRAQADHAHRLLLDTAASTNAAVELLRSNALAALEALHLVHEITQTPAPASPRVGAGHNSPEPAAIRLGGERPAAVAGGEAARQPATRRGKGSVLDPHRDELIKAYTDGTSPSVLAAEYGVTDVTIRNYLQREGVRLRTRSEAQKTRPPRTTPTGASA